MQIREAVGVVNQTLRAFSCNADTRDVINQAFDAVLKEINEGAKAKAELQKLVQAAPSAAANADPEPRPDSRAAKRRAAGLRQLEPVKAAQE